jgi:hypothetical protein
MSQFPVSSGKQHQAVENEWVPVTTSSTSSLTPSATNTIATIPKPAAKPVMTLQKQIEEQLPELLPPAASTTTTDSTKAIAAAPYDWRSDDHYNHGNLMAMAAAGNDNVSVIFCVFFMWFKF